MKGYEKAFSSNIAYLTGTPGASGFGSASTAEEVAKKNEAQIKGKTFIVTGASAGIGLETARVLASKGGHVIMACRASDHAKKAYETVQVSAANGAKVELRDVDLCNFASVRKFASELNAAPGKLDVLVNNAGCLFGPYKETVDRHESMLQSNHLGPFLLTFLLLDKFKSSGGPDSRIVNVASEAHRFSSSVNLSDFEQLKAVPDKGLPGWGAIKTGFSLYGQTKLMNMLHALHLNKLMQSKQETKHITAYSVHPGMIKTRISRNYSQIINDALFFALYPVSKTIPQGAATTIYCAVDPRARFYAGGYFCDCNPYEPTPEAKDAAAAASLWKDSLNMTGLGSKA